MKAFFYLFVATFFWGLNFHLAKMMLQTTSSFEAGFWRYLFGVLVLLLASYRTLPNWQTFKTHKKGLLLVGIVGLFGFNTCFFWGMQSTTAVNASLIISLNPALTLLFSALILKTELKKQHLLGISFALIGVLYLLSKGDFTMFRQIQFSKGDLLIFMSNAIFALHHIWIKKYAVNISNQQFTLLTNVLCFVGFALCLPFIETRNFVTYPTEFWLASVGIGAFGTAVAFFLWNSGVQKVGANQAGIFMNIVPLSAAVLAVFFNETLHFYHLWSALFILTGILIMRAKTFSFQKKLS